MSHQTHYRSYRGRVFYGSNDPTNSVKALKEALYEKSHILILRLVFVSATINVATILAMQDALLIPGTYSVKALGAQWGLSYNLQNLKSCKIIALYCCFNSRVINFVVTRKTELYIMFYEWPSIWSHPGILFVARPVPSIPILYTSCILHTQYLIWMWHENSNPSIFTKSKISSFIFDGLDMRFYVVFKYTASKASTRQTADRTDAVERPKCPPSHKKHDMHHCNYNYKVLHCGFITLVVTSVRSKSDYASAQNRLRKSAFDGCGFQVDPSYL